MKEKEKAYMAFEKVIRKEIAKAEERLEKRIIRNMNAVGNDGTEYTSEAEIMDAYGYDLISDAERSRLLQALEYKENRPKLMEDTFLLLCRKSLALADEERAKDEAAKQQAERQAIISEIRRRGNQPKCCICCGEIIGEVLGGSIIGTDWYDNHGTCRNGHVCKACFGKCGGKIACPHEEE